ncbi:MAG TPA: hypothetical protein VGG03_27295 [Thermoanaerobaculia bacterium]|jgi:hypothetical protein
MEISNGTNDDAKVKVSGGGSGESSKGWRFQEVETQEWPLPRGKTIKPPWPPLPCTVFFSVKKYEISREVRSAAIKGLRLTKRGSNGYEVKPVRDRKKKPRSPRS